MRIEVSAEVYGFRYIVVGRALKNKAGSVVGCVVLGFPLTLEDELSRMATDLASAMQEFAATFENVMEIAENSNTTASSVEQTAQTVGQTLASTGTLTTGITRVADRTRLLGLNASIEAAHAGKAGAGFAVVAREIQALSDQSIKAAHEVNTMLAGLSGQTTGLNEAVELLRADSEKLRTALREATAYVERLATMADTLQTLATRSAE
jgi:methyl-accepting chemotaxis protein